MLVNLNSTIADDIIIKEETLISTPGKNLKVKTFSGDVSVSTWSAEGVYVKITGNESAKDNLDITLESSDDGVKVIIEEKNNSNLSGLNLKIDIRLPQSYNADISSAEGNLKLNGVSGNIEMKTADGDIKTSEISGSLDLKTAGGNIESLNFSGNISVSTAGGDIYLDGSNGKISGATEGGDIKLHYKGENKEIKLTTSGGDIEVTLPSNFAADCKLTTYSGEINSEIPITVSKKTDMKLKGTMNGGGELLKCSTSGGDINIFAM
jgi:DUF4097 and DUF4098 domain-containing protein YvlB